MGENTVALIPKVASVSPDASPFLSGNHFGISATITLYTMPSPIPKRPPNVKNMHQNMSGGKTAEANHPKNISPYPIISTVFKDIFLCMTPPKKFPTQNTAIKIVYGRLALALATEKWSMI